jgi:hypothetical protein
LSTVSGWLYGKTAVEEFALASIKIGLAAGIGVMSSSNCGPEMF